MPLATWIGTFTDWRGVMLCVAAADLVAVAGLRLTLPASPRKAGGGGDRGLGLRGIGHDGKQGLEHGSVLSAVHADIIG